MFEFSYWAQEGTTSADYSDPQVLATVATAVATIALAVLTAIYAYSSVQAAKFARDAAEASVIQNVLLKQPRMTARNDILKVDWILSSVLVANESNWPVPVRTSVEIENSGSGPASAITSHFELLETTFDLDNSTAALREGGSTAFAFSLAPADRVDLAERSESLREGRIGNFMVACTDSVGFKLTFQWAVCHAHGDLMIKDEGVSYAPAAADKGLHHEKLLERWRWLLESR